MSSPALPEKFFNFEYDCVKPQEEKAEEIVYEILLVVILVTDPLRCVGVSHDHFCVFENAR